MKASSYVLKPEVQKKITVIVMTLKTQIIDSLSRVETRNSSFDESPAFTVVDGSLI